MMEAEIIHDASGREKAYICSLCGGVFKFMWGNKCDKCREEDKRHQELINELKRLADLKVFLK